MNWAKALPVAMIIQSAAASAIYFSRGNVRMGLYWFFAAAINGTVTF